MSNVLEIKKDIYYTGVLDKDLEVFDIIMETEFGTTYNSYLIKDEKTVLIDTVKSNFKDIFFEKNRGNNANRKYRLYSSSPYRTRPC